jgi:hypothetical protein
VIRAAIAVGALLDLALVRVLPESGAFVYPRLAAATFVLLLPGALIADALGRRSMSATLLWSLAALTVALGIVFLLGLSLTAALLLLAAIAVAALVVSLRLRRPRPPRIRGSGLVFAAGALYGLALWHVAGHVDGDGLFHLARVRKLVAFDDLSLHAVGEFEDGGLHPGYAFPLWHGFLACVARLAGVDPELAVLHESSLLAPIAFLVVFEAGATLFRSGWLGGAVLVGNLGMVSLAAGHGGAYASLALPGTASRQLLVPAVLTLVFAHLHEPSRAVLAGLAAGGLVLTLVHPTYSLFLTVPLAGFLAVRVLFDRRDARHLLGALAAFLVPTIGVAAALLPVVRDTVSHDPGQTELDRGLRQYAGQLDFVGDGYRLAPDMLSRSGAVAVAALALVPLAGLLIRRRWAGFVVGGSLAVLLLMLVPHLFEPLSDAVSLSQSRRAAGFLPFAFAFAGGAAVLARLLGVLVLPLALAAGVALQLAYPGDFTLRLERGGGPAAITWFALVGGVAALALGVALLHHPPDRRRVLGGLAALLFVLPVSVHAATLWSPPATKHRSPLTPGLVEALRERVPAGAVVFSDLETSYRIGAAAPVYVAVNPPAHVADTEANRPYERRKAVREFFDVGNLDVACDYGADWIVVDRWRFRDPLREQLPGSRPVYGDERYALWAYC